MKSILRYIYYVIIYNFVLLVTKLNMHSYFFNSYNGKNFSGNPRAIFDYLINEYPNHKFVVFLNNEKDEKNLIDKYSEANIQIIRKKNISFLWNIAKCRYWFINVNFPYQLKPQKKGIYVQTWHGTPLKHIGEDIIQDLPDKKWWRKETLNWDYFLSNSTTDQWIYESAFGINKSIILNYGLPRNDVMILNHEQQNQVTKRQLGIHENKTHKRIILYAPTFRDDDKIFQLKLDIKRFAKQFENDTLLIKLHPNVSKSLDQIDLTKYGNIINVSHFEDTQKLLFIADVLITDYSSIFFDFSMLNKPILFFAYDLDKYEEQLRGFYFQYRDFVPGKILTNNTSLFIELKKLENDVYFTKCSKLTANFSRQHNANNDGGATAKVVKKILSER